MHQQLYRHFLTVIAAIMFSLCPLSPVLASHAAVPTYPEAVEGGPHYLTISAAAFHPATENYDYQVHGRYLIHNGVDSGTGVQPDSGNYLAAVQLPQGAQIAGITYFWKDPGVGVTSVSLSRLMRTTDLVQEITSIGSVDTFPPSFGSTYESAQYFAIDAPIDNLTYTYFLRIDIDGGGVVWACAVQIEYTTAPGTPDPGLIAIPPAAFTPFSDQHHYYNFGYSFENFNGPASLSGRGWYVAPVNLPEGATVTGLILQWKRNLTTSQQGTAILQRSLLSNGNYDNLASVSSEPGSGTLVSSTTTHTISNPLISNSLYTYWVVLDLPNSNPINVEPRDVDIQYTLPATTNNVLAVPAPAFQPYENGYTYQNSGRALIHHYGPGGSSDNGWYLAPLNLPDGVQITRLDFYWFENTTIAGIARLQRTTLNQGNYQDLAVATTSTGSNNGSVSFDTTIDGGPVDNSRFAYWLVVDIPSDAFLTNVVKAYSVKLYYNFTLYLPIERR
jgi:hypothetical protein